MRAIILYVDAMPFMYSNHLVRVLKNFIPGLRASALRPVLGYTDCFKVTLLTGMPPNKHGYWVSYTFRENPINDVKINLLKKVSILDRYNIAVKGIRFVLSKVYPLHMIPTKILPYIRLFPVSPEADIQSFDYVLRKLGYRTIFTFIENQGYSYEIIEDRFYRHNLYKIKKIIESIRKDIIFLYIDEPDFWGHRYGPNSKIYINSIKWLINYIGKIVYIAYKRGAIPIIFSDHGMSPVYKILDIYKLLLKDPKLGKDYIVGVDATFLRIFFINKVDSPYLDLIRKIMKLFGSRLSDYDYEKNSIPMNRIYGDEVWLLRPGVCLFPNYFSWMPPKGMHAYIPEEYSQLGLVITHRDLLNENCVNVVDLHKIIMGILK